MTNLPTPPQPPDQPTASIAARLKRLDVHELVAGGASLVLLVTLFLPWYRYTAGGSSISFSAMSSAAGGWRVLILIACLAIVGYLGISVNFTRPRLPIPAPQALVVATAVNMLLVVVAFATVPTSALGGFAVFVHTGTAWGAYIGMVAALVALLAAVLYVRQPIVTTDKEVLR